MTTTELEDFVIPEHLYPKHILIDLDIIRYGVFFRKIPEFNEKKIDHSCNESYHHVALKALAYYELSKLYPESDIRFESHHGTWQELDLRCSVRNITKVVVEVGDSNVNFDNVLNRGLNISEEVWLIPYYSSERINNNNMDKLLKNKNGIYAIFSFRRGKHWGFYEKLKEGNEHNAQVQALLKPHATITIGQNHEGYYLTETQYNFLKQTSIERGYKNSTLLILDLIDNIIKLNKNETVYCLACKTKLNVLDNFCRNCGQKIDNISNLKKTIETSTRNK